MPGAWPTAGRLRPRLAPSTVMVGQACPCEGRGPTIHELAGHRLCVLLQSCGLSHSLSHPTRGCSGQAHRGPIKAALLRSQQSRHLNTEVLVEAAEATEKSSVPP